MAQLQLMLASQDDRIAIYAIRYDIYAKELEQHPPNPEGSLSDELDCFNEYIVAKRAQTILGFISITPPGSPRYSIDKYLDRKEFAFPFDGNLCELRILTIRQEHRGTELALLLMFSALRWAESNHASRILAMGRKALLPFYKRVGFELLGKPILSGSVEFEAMTATSLQLRSQLSNDLMLNQIIMRGLEQSAWQLPFSSDLPSNSCMHGGEFFEAIGEDLQTLERRAEVISADVLDAWFPPAPEVIEVLTKDLPWLLQTSPPLAASGLVNAISHARTIPKACILAGAGSSDLIYLAFQRLLTRKSRVLVLDPMYGEYAYVCEQLLGMDIDRFILKESDGFAFDDARFERQLQSGYDVIVLVNPNNPTGTYIQAEVIERVLSHLPPSTILWIDEAYIDFVQGSQTLEGIAARSRNVIVCKTLSKAYALSGARVAYLVAHPDTIAALRQWTPPWSVSLPAQYAAIETLKHLDYYSARHLETETLRAELAAGLENIPGITIISGIANFLLCKLPSVQLQDFLPSCRSRGLYMRDVSSMGRVVPENIFRISVKDHDTNHRMLRIIDSVLKNSVAKR